MLYACDGRWWDVYYDDVKINYRGEPWTQDKEAAEKYGLRYVESRSGPGLETNPALIVQGQNGGYQAINLAYHFGAEIVLLLGYDMSRSNPDHVHWHGNHPHPLSNSANYTTFAKNFTAMEPEKYGLRVINCSRQTAITCFERMDIESAIKSCAA